MRKIVFQVSILCLTLPLHNLIQADDSIPEQDFTNQYFIEESEYIPEYCGNNCGTFSVGGDWLEWKVEQQKMQVGAAVTVTPLREDGISIVSKVLKPKFKTDSGYRVFTGYTTPDQLWNINAIFTHVPSSAGFKHVGNPANIDFDFVSIFSTNFPLITAISNEAFSSVRSRWNVDVSYFDVDLSRRFSLCDSLEIKPHIGVRGQWINQKFKISGIDTLTFSATLNGRLRGIGLEGGLWGSWNIACGFSLIGHVGGSIIYAHSHNSGNLAAFAGNVLNVRYSDSGHISLTGLDSFLGLSYSLNWSEKLINLHIGWEQHLILNTNQFSIAGGGDMTLQGLTLGAAVGF